jgi:hypothetical protein
MMDILITTFFHHPVENTLILQQVTERDAPNVSLSDENLAEEKININGLWSGTQDVIKKKSWFSLWNGVGYNCFFQYQKERLTPILSELLTEKFKLYDPYVVPLIHQTNFLPNLTVSIFSQTVISTLLSPFESLRIKAATQESYFQSIKEVFMDPFKNIELSFLHHLVSSTFYSMTPLVLVRWLHISLKTDPVRYGFYLFFISTLQLLIIMPLETIRYKLLIESETFLDISFYPNFFSCMQGIWRGRGLRGFFRGFLTRMTFNAVICILGVIGNIDFESDDGDLHYWK